MRTRVLYAYGSSLSGNRFSRRNLGIVRKSQPRPAGRRHLNAQPVPPHGTPPESTREGPAIRPRPTARPRQTPRARRFPVERAPPACAFDWKPTRSRNTTGTATTPGRLFSGRLGAFLGSDIMKVILGSSEWCCWDSWDDPERGCVQICHKGAPGRDQWRAEARNINVSSRVFRLDPGLCGRFGQLAPPRALWGGRLPASARSMTSTPARTPARRAVADRASTPFDRAGPARAPPRAPRRRPNPRDRHLTHENVPLTDDLAGYPTISAVK